MGNFFNSGVPVTAGRRGLPMQKKGLININITLNQNVVNVSIGKKSGKGQNRSLTKMIFWRVFLPIIIFRDDLVCEGKYFTNTKPYILC